jgi:thymidylate synthase
MKYVYKSYHESKYKELLKCIMIDGEQRLSRTGVNTISYFSPPELRYDISGGKIPLLTLRKCNLRPIFEELMWFIRGETDVKILENKNIHIWSGNTSRKALDSVGLIDREVGQAGPIYGHQWRNFDAEYPITDKKSGVDQLYDVIKKIKENPYDRRIIMCTWNPKQLNLMALPPCHILYQWYVHFKDNKPYGISCKFYQRSSDIFLACNWNVVSATLLTYLIANQVGLEPLNIIMTFGDAHIYENHIQQVKTLIQRECKYTYPILYIVNKRENIEDYIFSDLVLSCYTSHPSISGVMNV